MVQLQESRDSLNEVGIQVVGLSYDPVDVLKEFSDEEEIAFPLLSDEESKTIHAYDLHFENGLPHPGTLLIDKEGIIRVKLFKDGYRTRHTVNELLSAADDLP